MSGKPREIRVKICGLTNLEDAQVAAQAGADLLGFIFYPPSPRYVTPAQVRGILAELRDSIDGPLPRTVGVFVDEPLEAVQAILEEATIDYAQLHGGEPPVLLEQLAGRAFKALRPSSREEALADAEWYAELGLPDGPQLLLDAYDPQAYGGTGRKADWAVAQELARSVRLLLAGGLTPANVARAVETVQPWGVDVSSGVERAPGRKDHAAVRAFVARAKGLPEP